MRPNTAGLDKLGAGTLTLTATNAYTGATTVTAGTLELGNGGATGALSSASAITIAGGATFAVNQSDTVTQGPDFGSIAGAGTFEQNGAGRTELTLANTHAGPTNVNAGNLQVGVAGAGSTDSSLVTVASGATLSGTGTITNNVSLLNGAALNPGDSGGGSGNIGTLTIGGALTPQVGSNINLELASALGTVAGGNLNTPDENRQAILDNHTGEDPTTQHDSIEMGTLDLTLGGTINVIGLVGWTPGQGQYFDLFDGTISSDASTFNTYGVSNGISGGLRFRSGSQSANFQLKLPNIAAVSPALRWDTSLFLSHGIIFINPEPSRALLLLMGFAATILRRRRRRGRRS